MTAEPSAGGMPPAINCLFKFILRSPLHGILSKNFLLMQRSPYDAPFYGVTLDENKTPRPEEVEAGAQTTVMIRVALI